MFKKILFATDFSDTAKRAYDALKKIRVECGAQNVVLVHIIDGREVDSLANFEGFYSVQLDNIRKELADQMTKKAEQELESYKTELRNLGYQVEIRIFEGIPYDEIVNVANKENVSLIVMGSNGKGIIQELFIGSTSDKVIRQAKCPVLIVR